MLPHRLRSGRLIEQLREILRIFRNEQHKPNRKPRELSVQGQRSFPRYVSMSFRADYFLQRHLMN